MSPKYIPLTKKEIVAQFPTNVPSGILEDDSTQCVQQFYGPAVQWLTRYHAYDFIGKEAYVLLGQSWLYNTYPKTIDQRTQDLTRIKIIDVSEDDDVLVSDYGTGINTHIYFDGTYAATGSGLDCVFVFVKTI